MVRRKWAPDPVVQYGAGGGPPPALTYPQEVLLDSPVGYWRLNEVAGTNAIDLGSGANDGTYTGGFTLGQPSLLASDPAARSVLVDGATGYVAIPDLAAYSLITTGQLTLEALINPNGPSSGQIIAKGDGNYEWALQWDFDGNVTNILWTNGGSDRYTPIQGGPVATGVISLIAVTLDNAIENALLYINGVLIASDLGPWVGASANTTSPVNIGRRPDNVQFLDTFVQEVAIYDTALPAARLLAHYNASL